MLPLPSSHLSRVRSLSSSFRTVVAAMLLFAATSVAAKTPVSPPTAGLMTTGNPAIASNGSEAVVVWTANIPSGLFMRMLNADGTPRDERPRYVDTQGIRVDPPLADRSVG